MAENNTPNNAPEQDVKQLLKVRREKLAALQEAGKDPFVITKFDQTHHAQEIKDNFKDPADPEDESAREYVSICKP